MNIKRVSTFSKLAKALLIAGLIGNAAFLSGCGSEQDVSIESVEPTPEERAATNGSVIMDFTNGNIPFPHDALFSGSQDGTLNIPVADSSDMSDPTNALNALDGFSTSSAATFSLSKSLDITDANFNSIADALETGLEVFETLSDPQTKAVTAIVRQLVPGVDYLPAVTDAEAKQMAIVPLKPFNPKTTYLVVVNQQAVDSDQRPFAKSLIYSALSGADSLVGSSLEELEPLRLLTLAQLQALGASGENTSEIVASWSFTTQSTSDVLQTLKSQLSQVPNESLAFADAGMDTSTFGGLGVAQVYSGSLTVPYYGAAPSQTNPTAPLSNYWKGQGNSFLTQFIPVAVKRFDQTVPVLMSVPKNGEKPDAGWPVVIFQHGITRNRGDLLAVADSLAAAGYAAVSMDMPLHGISPDEDLAALRNPLIAERTFDVDYVTQAADESIVAMQPDGVVDTTGRHFVNLSHLLVTRDNLRQAVSDLMQLQSALESYEGELLDGSQVAFVGHSLGGMVGGVFGAMNTEKLDSSVFAMPGLQAANVLVNSPVFSAEIIAGLQAQGVEPGSAEFTQFVLATQTVVDSADPVNYVASIQNPTLLLAVVGDGVDPATSDQFIPNRVAGAPLAGTEPWIALQGLNSVNTSGIVAEGKGVMRYTSGTHRSFLTPLEGAEVTQTMQEAMASFTASKGTAISISSDNTLQ